MRCGGIAPHILNKIKFTAPAVLVVGIIFALSTGKEITVVRPHRGYGSCEEERIILPLESRL
jgi:hypothetical protein